MPSMFFVRNHGSLWPNFLYYILKFLIEAFWIGHHIFFLFGNQFPTKTAWSQLHKANFKNHCWMQRSIAKGDFRLIERNEKPKSQSKNAALSMGIRMKDDPLLDVTTKENSEPNLMVKCFLLTILPNYLLYKLTQ